MMPKASKTTVSRSEEKNLKARSSMSGVGFGECDKRVLLRRHGLGVAEQFIEPVTAAAGDDGAEQSLIVIRHVHQDGVRVGGVKRRHHRVEFSRLHLGQTNLPPPAI